MLAEIDGVAPPSDAGKRAMRPTNDAALEKL